MKKLIRYPEEVYAMTTIGRNSKPAYMVAVNPDSNRIGDCYFKFYDSDSYSSSSSISRIRFDSPKYVKPHKGKHIVKLNATMKNELNKFMKTSYQDFPEITNWDYTKYAWNLDHNLVKSYVEGKTPLQSYIDGDCDTEENLSNPNYVPNSLECPDYTKLP